MSGALVAPSFDEGELVASRDHAELAYTFADIGARRSSNATRLLCGFMQPARDFAGRIDVLSFVRSPALNTAIPGAKPDSDHLDGNACDFRTAEAEPAAFLEAARRDEIPGAEWDKLNLYTESATFHVANRPLEEGPGRRRVFIDWQEQ